MRPSPIAVPLRTEATRQLRAAGLIDLNKVPRNGVERPGNMFSLSPDWDRSFERARKSMIKIKINGQEQSWDGDPTLPLLWYLRDEIGLTGAKFGCGQALCGSCTVLIDGQAVRSCITAMSDTAGREITTIEGLHPTGDHPVQKGMATGECAAVRLLPVRTDHAGRRPARRESEAQP